MSSDAYPVLRREADALETGEVYETIDLPLVPILLRMEETGVRIDRTSCRRCVKGYRRKFIVSVKRFTCVQASLQRQFAEAAAMCSLTR